VEPIARPLSVEPDADSALSMPRSDIARLTMAIAAGDEEAFRQFHKTYFDRLFRYLLVILRGDEEGARDALQETMLRVVRHARRIDEEAELWGWLTVLARSAALDAGRKQSRYWAALKRFFIGAEEAPIVSHPTAKDATELYSLLEECLNRLEPIERQLLEGKYFDRASVESLAAATGLTSKAVESRLHRARVKLRHLLTQELNDENSR
jgi:RNA polymerase sigma-70 factor (ECF subfamily)